MSSGSGSGGLFYSYATTTAKLFFCILKHDPVTNALQITQRPCNGPCLDLLLINLAAAAAAAACGTIVRWESANTRRRQRVAVFPGSSSCRLRGRVGGAAENRSSSSSSNSSNRKDDPQKSFARHRETFDVSWS